MIQTGAENHVHVGIPIKCVHAKLMTILEFMLQLQGVHLPQRNYLVHACGGDIVHGGDWKQVHDVARVHWLIIFAHIFQLDIVGVDFTIEACSEDPIERRATPFDAQLDQRTVSRVLALVVCCRIPQLDNVVATRGHHKLVSLLLIPLHSDEVRCYEGATCDGSFTRWDTHQ